MATFEKRKNATGQITAIRVKIRRVGMPHISQTFPVANGTQTALKQAEKAAKAWVDEVTKGFGIQHGNLRSIKAQFNQLGNNEIHHATFESTIEVHFPFKRTLSKDQGNYFITHAETYNARMLAALMLDCGLSVEEVKKLRWQNILLNQKLIEVFGDSGLLLRQVPLTDLTIEMLLSHNQRKYGLLFSDLELSLSELLPKGLISTLQQNQDVNLANALKREAAYRMADNGENENSICAFLGINTLTSLNTYLKHDISNQSQVF